MKKLIILIALALVFLTGCVEQEEPKVVGQIVGATVVDKQQETKIDSGGRYEFEYTVYSIIVAKNGQKFNFQVNQATYNVVTKGVKIDGAYYDDGHLGDVTFPQLLDKPVDKSHK